MPAEYVLVSADPLTDAALHAAIGRTCPGASVLRAHAGGFRSVMSADSHFIATFFDTRAVVVVESARRASRADAALPEQWTDVVVTLNDSLPGLQLARAVAEQLAGQLAERN